MAFAGVTVREALDSALVAITATGSTTPRLDAELLLAWAMGTSRTALAIHPEAEVEGTAARRFRDAVTRRSAGREPVAYIVGMKGFRHLDLQVDGRVLIPRPETEHLVEAAIALAAPGAHVVDVGTGSGAVALALKDERPDLRVTATDVSADALAVARANAERLGLELSFSAGDLLDAPVAGPIDLVVSNPPYVPDGDRAALAAEITRHEPAGALFAGADGLDVFRRMVEQCAARQVAMVALEFGAGQAEGVSAILRAAGYEPEATIPDLAGIDRVITARAARRPRTPDR